MKEDDMTTEPKRIPLATRLRVRRIMTAWWIREHLPRLYTAWRLLCGARRPSKSGKTDGAFDAPGVSISFGGACPVQGDGEIDDYGVYYRSRGETWSLDVYDRDVDGDLPGPEHEVWSFSRREYIGYDGGWINADESRRNIGIAVRKFRERAERRAP